MREKDISCLLLAFASVSARNGGNDYSSVQPVVTIDCITRRNRGLQINLLKMFIMPHGIERCNIFTAPRIWQHKNGQFHLAFANQKENGAIDQALSGRRCARSVELVCPL
jgi:hypothetical protein